ncbi:MAG: tRNA threonylcarbamoyladenosine dehydratase [Ruminococcaceae bacterium]|nr:tRNA threonylcarbamoyladenosine dehydratase [Oscillospiraceae bacterium]
MNERFLRTAALIGEEAVGILQNSKVVLFGLGGVGSFVAEALVRSSVGEIDIYDNDTVDITNINRQLIALENTIGRLKTQVTAERLKQINPDVKVLEHPVFVTPEIIENTDFSKFDYVIDAIDNVTAKIAICKKAREYNIPVISAMGAGNKLDPTLFEIAPIEKTSVCPLARVMRLELRKRNITGVKAAFSKEPVIKNNKSEKAPASIAFVPSVMGLIIAGEVIKDIIRNKEL